MDDHADPKTTSTDEHDTATSEAQEALHRLLTQGHELYAYVLHFVSAQVDALKLSGRHIAFWAVVASLAMICVVSALAMSVILFLTGLSTGIGMAFGGVLWLGQIIVGLGFLLSFAGVIYIGWSRIRNRSLTQKVQDYAERQRQQHVQFGHNAADRAGHSTV